MVLLLKQPKQTKNTVHSTQTIDNERRKKASRYMA